MAIRSSTLVWKIPWMEEPGRLQSMGSLESDTTEWLHFHFSLSCIGEGNGNPLQCSCLENPRDGGAWRGCTESDTLKWLSSSNNNVFLLGFSLPRTLHFLDLVEYFLSHVKEFFSNYLIKYFLRSFLSLFSPGTPKMQMLACLILSQRSLKLSSSFYIYLFIYLFFWFLCFFYTLFLEQNMNKNMDRTEQKAVISTILPFRSLTCSSASVILVLISSSVLFISVCSLVLLGLR